MTHATMLPTNIDPSCARIPICFRSLWSSKLTLTWPVIVYFLSNFPFPILSALAPFHFVAITYMPKSKNLLELTHTNIPRFGFCFPTNFTDFVPRTHTGELSFRILFDFLEVCTFLYRSCFFVHWNSNFIFLTIFLEFKMFIEIRPEHVTASFPHIFFVPWQKSNV